MSFPFQNVTSDRIFEALLSNFARTKKFLMSEVEKQFYMLEIIEINSLQGMIKVSSDKTLSSFIRKNMFLRLKRDFKNRKIFAKSLLSISLLQIEKSSSLATNRNEMTEKKIFL